MTSLLLLMYWYYYYLTVGGMGFIPERLLMMMMMIEAAGLGRSSSAPPPIANQGDVECTSTRCVAQQHMLIPTPTPRVPCYTVHFLGPGAGHGAGKEQRLARVRLVRSVL